MKKLLLILLCLPIIGFGQDNDILILQNKVEDISYRMDKHHQQYKKSVITLSVGTLVTAFGVFAATPAVAIIGGVASLTGGIIMIDSHKWFKKPKFSENKTIQKLLKRKIDLEYLLESAEIGLEEYNKEIKKLNELIQQLKQ
jgi:hypothetical protein